MFSRYKRITRNYYHTMFAKQFTLSFSSADMNYIYFFVYALYTVTKRSRKQDHSTVSKTHKVSQNNLSNQVKIISTKPHLRDKQAYEWEIQPLVCYRDLVFPLFIVHLEN